MSRQHFTRGNQSYHYGLGGPGRKSSPLQTAQIGMDGERCCLLCPKILNATEISIRTHLRAHVKKGHLKPEEALSTFKDILYQRKKK